MNHLTVNEAALQLKIDPAGVRDAIRRGAMIAERKGPIFLIREREVARYDRERRISGPRKQPLTR